MSPAHCSATAELHEATAALRRLRLQLLDPPLNGGDAERELEIAFEHVRAVTRSAELAYSSRRAGLLAAVSEVRAELTMTAALLENLRDFRQTWLERAGLLAAGYTRRGTPAPPPVAGRVNLRA